MKIRISYKKAVHELLCVLAAISGIVLFILSITHNVPVSGNFDSLIYNIVVLAVSYGFFFGIVIFALALFAFFEVRQDMSEKYFPKKNK